MKNLIYIFLAITITSCGKFSILNEFKKEEKKVVSTPVTKLTTAEVEKTISEIKKIVPKKRKYTKVKNTKAVKGLCKKIDKSFYRYGWGKSKCDSFKWHHVRNSVKGDPLMWVSFGDEKKHKQTGNNMTMILCGVHGDEITPVKFCFDILHHLYQLQHNVEYKEKFDDSLIVVVPVANPDSFFKKWPSRTNARKVDINRNFPTKDWWAKAHKTWRVRYRKDKRRNPGKKPLSEPETLFQVNLIKRYAPTKIISVHAPLTIIDYDGPTVATKHFHHVALNAKNLLVQMSKSAKDYRIKDYPFFPGSLGNYAGNERNIPTYTLELPSSDNRKHRAFWNMFKKSMNYALFDASMMPSKIVSNDAQDKKDHKSKN